MHEILTVTFGRKSNFCWTHFWNTQESYFVYDPNDHAKVNVNTNFRVLKKRDPEAIVTVPRECIYDTPIEFGNTRKNWLEELNESSGGKGTAWDGKLTQIMQTPVDVHPYQEALWSRDEIHEGNAIESEYELPSIRPKSVKYWSDFNRLFLDTEYLFPVNCSELNSSDFSFQLGVERFHDFDKQFNVWDEGLRPLVEECDSVQGFQAAIDIDTPWGGFASEYMKVVQDELGECRVPTWVYGIREPIQSDSSATIDNHFGKLNEALSLSQLNGSCSQYFPLCTISQGDDLWASSAKINLAIESFTLPTRVYGSSCYRMKDIESKLQSEGRGFIHNLNFKAKNYSSKEWALVSSASFVNVAQDYSQQNNCLFGVVRSPKDNQGLLEGKNYNASSISKIVNIQNLGLPSLETVPEGLRTLDTVFVEATNDGQINSHIQGLTKSLNRRFVSFVDQDELEEIREILSSYII
ncbi:Protein dml1 [Schizosaccharomyces pombe]|uniref:Protein dml1 n=1 Tax=Schizosaccharomyces pombe (strain 972 / ATCC 24843) TaxID=284812 RepID=DML1_SCHPO|nr:putative GTPase dml1 [Schizosaccharomyces pombe]Q9P6K5.1 RecName: Full=Protein dml1 [Schizosaccharomyces pombe 972h-]CAB90793.1 mitochondrial inheritance GTPase (predicted) [Schizosaccharomyces pombe]|eukprot:NP_594658.1 putative GTPase dml1 [Schizosaccharomyces pombe]